MQPALQRVDAPRGPRRAVGERSNRTAPARQRVGDRASRRTRRVGPTTRLGVRGLAGNEGDWVPALGLGMLAAVVVIAVFVVARRRRRRVRRWAVYAVGGVASLVALFFFFGAMSPLLPASF